MDHCLLSSLDLLITFGSMFIRSVKDDHGYHIHKEELWMI